MKTQEHGAQFSSVCPFRARPPLRVLLAAYNTMKLNERRAERVQTKQDLNKEGQGRERNTAERTTECPKACSVFPRTQMSIKWTFVLTRG